MMKRYYKKLIPIFFVFLAIPFNSCNKAAVAHEEKVSATLVANEIPFRDFLGVNVFEWDFTSDPYRGVIDERKFQVIKSFSGVRHYLDWERVEHSDGAFTFSPSHHGDWDYDKIYQQMKAAGKFVLLDLKGCPNWLLASYPADKRDAENVPAPYGLDRSDPASYIKQARAGFQLAARYGSNKDIDKALLLIDGSTRWRDDPQNIAKTGLNLITYIECDNERDKWWKGPLAQQSPEEYAANLSAFYDGHKGKLGKGIGVKTADPNMLVVMGGIAEAKPDFVRKMVEWCAKNRGMKANGQIDLCFDIINYHHYSNDAYRNNGNATVGVAPEQSNLAEVAAAFVKYAKTVNGGLPVWITETGFDVGEHTSQRAISIGNKSAQQTQADWNLRTALLYSRSGLSKCIFYMLDNVDVNSWTQYTSSGFINPDFSKRPSADYVSQVNNLLGAYHFQSTINSDPLVDVYDLNGEKIYVLTIPDQVGRSKLHTLNLGTHKEAEIFSPAFGKNEMESKTLTTKNGLLEIAVTETPIFVRPK
ncbi:hypothetical protein [Pedobacter sandarakinus]|uniref:hypothetical protein n=1 Tax=Pedobacter sandarakinus TaxID=353156 RepID=UPI0022478D71|nr:hypothetical protein [Pedobacter sandarakinus]MCX2574868.1 hypothetical protein [Pedobacter sandarakinus]